MMSELCPQECRSFKAVCKLRRDHFEAGDFDITVDGCVVHLAEQKLGESPKQKIIMPRAVFAKLANWWHRPQIVRKKP